MFEILILMLKGILYFLGFIISKRGLLLCNLARKGVNPSSSEKQILNTEECSEIDHEGGELVIQQENSEYNKKGRKT